MRFLPVSLDTILVELAGLDETLALFASLEAVPVAGIVETVPAARTLMVRFRPERLTAEALAASLATRDLSAKARDGALSSAEQEELDRYERVDHMLALLKSKARRSVKERKVKAR